MIYGKTLSIAIVYILVINNISLADLCLKLKDVSGGEAHTLALMEDNTLWACGSNGDKQLGLGSVTGTLTLEQVKGENGVGFLQNIVTFDAGWFHSLAADENGMIWAWGTDNAGQLGNGSNEEDKAYPFKVLGVGGIGYLGDTVPIVYVSAGRSGLHSLAVDSAGFVYAWGLNSEGQCGNESQDSTLQVPDLVHDDDPQTSGVYLGDVAFIIQADAGVGHSIALDDEGYVWHWGRGSSTGGYPEKVRQAGGALLTNIIGISCCDYSVAVDEYGNVWQWQYSNAAAKVAGGQMGTTYLENIAAVGAGNFCFMALTADGRVLTWNWGGSPAYVSDGQMDTDSGYLENIAAIDAGYLHKLAVDTDGHGWAWGTNSSGCLGIGQTGGGGEPALMSCAEVDGAIDLEKTADILGNTPSCARPFDLEEENYLIYEISYGNPDPNDPNYLGTLSDVVIIDTLPDEVEFDSASDNGQYDPNAKTVTWEIGTLVPGGSNSVTLIVMVNESAAPLSKITNTCEIITSQYYRRISMDVEVCCWGGGIIHVSENAVGYNTGVDWQSAYPDLQDALTRVAQNCGSEIWVAQGTYSPGTTSNATFTIPDGTSLYGGFYGNETDKNQRCSQEHKTCLSGNELCTNVVTMTNLGTQNDTILDGFSITRAISSGTRCTNCGNKTRIEHCQIYDCGQYGIYAAYSIPTILNTCLYHNDSDGIYLYNPSSAPTIRNNTIADNDGYAVYSDYGSAPAIDNCILWGNNQSGDRYQLFGCLAYYSCLSDPNDPNGVNDIPDQTYHNITADPNFPYPAESYNYHLAYDSPCKDKGDSNLVIPGELDMDGEYRIDDTIEIVDMGADEVHCEDVYNPLDWAGADGLVNLLEFSDMAAAWLSMDPNQIPEPDPNDSANWNPICDLDKDLDVDIDDLVLLCDEWLWRACWRDTEEMMGMMMMAPGGGESVSFSAASFSASASLAKTTPAEEPVPMATLEEMTTWLEEIYGDNEEFQLGYSPQEWQEFIDEVKATWDDSW